MDQMSQHEGLHMTAGASVKEVQQGNVTVMALRL
jgi:hypothetical protein